MKKEIVNLLKSNEGILKINKYFVLERHTKNALNQDVDELNLRCDLTRFAYKTVKIKSRDCEEIKKEISNQIFFIMNEVRNNMMDNLDNEYLE